LQNPTHTPKNLREGIVDVYSKEELEILCTDLGVKYDLLSGDTLPYKAQNLIEYMQRRGKLPVLITTLKEERPHINWDAVAGGKGGQGATSPFPGSSTPYQRKWIAIAMIVVLGVVGSVWSLLLTPTNTANPTPNPGTTSLQTVVEYYVQGKKLSKEGDYDAAIKQFTQVIMLNPEYAAAYNERGYAYQSKGEYDLAIQNYTQAIVLDEDYKDAYNNRGYVYYKKSEYDRAIQNFDQAIALDENYAYAYYNRGFVYKLKGEHDKAIADFRKYLDLEDDPYWSGEAQKHLRELGETP
jgi:Tfp pilus assembly protein PilF